MLQRVVYIVLGVVLGCGLCYGIVSRAAGQGLSFRLIGPNCALVGDVAYYLEITNPPFGWRQMPYSNKDLPPVPVSSLISYGSGVAITDSGEAWFRNATEWRSLGVLSTVPTKQTSWGALKARYATPAAGAPVR